MNYEELMIKARATNAKRDKSERRNGFPAESDLHPFIRIRTATMAIQAGIINDDWGAIAEAQALLEVVLSDLSKATGEKW